MHNAKKVLLCSIIVQNGRSVKGVFVILENILNNESECEKGCERGAFTALGYRIIPTPQIALQTKQFCLGNSSCGISIIHFVLYCTWLLMLRYHFVEAICAWWLAPYLVL